MHQLICPGPGIFKIAATLQAEMTLTPVHSEMPGRHTQPLSKARESRNSLRRGPYTVVQGLPCPKTGSVGCDPHTCALSMSPTECASTVTHLIQ